MATGFAASFWSSDYAGGLGVLFGKLQQGVQENQQIIAVARMRADAEEVYGNSLSAISPATDRVGGGFSRDEGASVRKAYEGVRTEMEAAASNHKKIASNIRELVVNPFGRWCEAHAARVQNSQDDLQSRIKIHDRQADAVRKFRSQYYNKCRLVEDLEEEDKLAFQDPQSEAAQSPKARVPTIKMTEPEDSDTDPIELGDETYQPEQVKKILTHMLESIKIGEAKVPILGTYLNCSNGADITDYIQKHMAATSVSYAERIGQDMVNHGFLRLVGNVGSTFANSSRMNYQWKTKAFELTGVPEKKQPLTRASTALSAMSNKSADSNFTVDTPVGAVQEYLQGWNPLNNQYPNETPSERLRREAREADERYKTSVNKLDSLRCNLEEAMVDHLKFMERCELDRLKAIKAVVLDFSGAISNVIPSLQSTVDKMMLFQETVQPLGDLRYMLENYRTGPFVPRVTTYENYYNSVDEQTFGVDLEARARSDKKRVPVLITTILTFLDNHYPDLEGDEARRGIWLVDVPLAQTHNLRATINTGKRFKDDVLEKYDVPIVASALKLYLLELPDSLVSSHVYEIIKTIYSTTATDASEETRVSVLQSTLGQLRLANIATLDAICTHFTRLIELTSADEAYVTALANALAPCVLRPKQDSSLSMNERYSYRLVRDLFAHKDAIFGELKRASTLTHSSSGAQRPRAISTDESNRRANMEERQRAIAAQRSPRDKSPGPGARSSGTHRRDRSQTRFPVNTASPTERRPTQRGSLEVPVTADSPDADETATTNGTVEPTPTPAPAPAPAPTTPAADHPAPSSTRVPFPRRQGGSGGGSLARGNRDSTGSLRGPANRDSMGSLRGEDGAAPRGVTLEDPPPAPRGVTLEDKPMDD
ncbi:Rho-GTPase-activating protein 8 [Dothidotthia symphoricarpi CBS 119687]|uniref:Rho-GTPase-activating protein 8 n=1 Tax=Dothidotthia symphoricarpi CBS 119687 TaxID=1392245 RepID=A0A6A6ASV1_9PLEO|nr:Rho-GTPase-activating protein 8 [Dothidotthia symphoricarpi CBS 119687]KAF2134034.1 Rho-GTPase-activating protein 8 [Dothidotthia symphoricarpi CBS 119687]